MLCNWFEPTPQNFSRPVPVPMFHAAQIRFRRFVLWAARAFAAPLQERTKFSPRAQKKNHAPAHLCVVHPEMLFHRLEKAVPVIVVGVLVVCSLSTVCLACEHCGKGGASACVPLSTGDFGRYVTFSTGTLCPSLGPL